MAISDKIRELDEQVGQTVRRAVDDLREEVRRRLDEATSELQRRLSEVAPDLPESFVSEEYLRRIAEEAAAPAPEALEQAREEGRAEGLDQGRLEGQSLGRAEGRVEGRAEGELQGRAEALETLRDAVAAIDRAGSQAEILEALLSAAAHHAGRTVILLVREGRLAGWGAHGFEAEAEAVRSLSLPADDEPWSELLAGGPARTLSGAACAPLVSQLDSPLPREGCAVPLVLRDRVAAVVYADRPEDARLDLAALQLLTYTGALALETLAFRQRDATATLAAAAGTAAAAEPALEEAAPAAPEVEEYPAAEEEGAGLEAGELEEPEAHLPPPHGDELLEAVEEEAAPAPSSPFDEGAFEEAALEEAPPLEAGVEEGYEAEPASEPFAAGETPETIEVEPAETIAWRTEPEPEVEEPEVEEPEIEEPEVEELQVEEPEVEEPAVEEPEVEEPEVEEPEAEPAELEGRPEAGEVPPPPPSPPAPGGQVAPPEDVEGPGWAFSATRGAVPKDTEAAHEEARRLARLLVSEIQLYNQEQVDEGRRNRDIYERLKDDIDRSRQLYEDRVDTGIRETTDYFYQELVRQLAAGDAKALGI